jgi:hypothetical protein
MFSRLFTKTYHKLSFEDVQFGMQHPEQFVIINTLPIYEQSCLIENTIAHTEEENTINALLEQNMLMGKKFIIYGRNNMDDTIYAKCDQLTNLGFQSVYLYIGGLFEWLTLQDIYGKDEFRTTIYILDILKYKPTRIFGSYMITN